MEKKLEFEVVFSKNRAFIDFPDYSVRLWEADVEELIYLVQNQIMIADDKARNGQPINFKGTFIYDG